ncbi:pentatricopeptide repeat-containing protein, mitochondrial [Fagus crenata]
MAITMLFEGYDPEAAIEIWNYMIENNIKPFDMSASALLLGLCDLGRFSDLRRFADDMLDTRVSIYESTMTHLKDAFYKEGRAERDNFDGILTRWKLLEFLV